jgi:hypothetical protein
MRQRWGLPKAAGAAVGGRTVPARMTGLGAAITLLVMLGALAFGSASASASTQEPRDGSSTQEPRDGCKLISKTTVAKLMGGFPHVAINRDYAPQCAFEAWRGSKPRSGKQVRAGYKNGTYADVAIRWFVQSEWPLAELMENLSKGSRELLRALVRCVGKPFQPAALNANGVLGFQCSLAHERFLKADWVKSSGMIDTVVDLELDHAQKTVASADLELNKLAAVIIPAAFGVDPLSP